MMIRFRSKDFTVGNEDDVRTFSANAKRNAICIVCGFDHATEDEATAHKISLAHWDGRCLLSHGMVTIAPDAAVHARARV